MVLHDSKPPPVESLLESSRENLVQYEHFSADYVGQVRPGARARGAAFPVVWTLSGRAGRPMSDQLLELTYRVDDAAREGRSGRTRLAIWSERLALWSLRLICLALLAWGVMLEARTSFVQSILFSRATAGMSFTLAAGASSEIRFPKGGPYDERLGYVRLPSAIAALRDRDFVVESQAVPSPLLREFIDLGGYALYREKGHAGLRLLDRGGATIYATDYSRARLPGVLGGAADRRKYAAVHRGPSPPRRRSAPAQSRHRLGALRSCDPRPGSRFHRPPPQARWRQHARDPDREIPPLAGRPHGSHGR